MEITGIIKHVLPVREGVSANGAWKTASYVIETEERYPRRMVFDVRDGRDGRIDRLGIKEGKRMKVWYDIDASEYNGRWYNNVTAWDAREVEQQDTVAQPAGDTAETAAPIAPSADAEQTKLKLTQMAEQAASGEEGKEGDDDLPF